MHGDTQPEDPADGGELLRCTQTAPVMVVRQNHLHRIERDGARQMPEGNRHHVGGQRHAGKFSNFAHFFERADRVFQVLEQAGLGQRRHQAACGLDGPASVGVYAQRVFGKSGAQGAQALDLELGLEHAGLELDGAKAVFIHHATRLLNQLLRGDGLAPVVTRVAGVTVVLSKFIKKVGAVSHMRAHCAAQQVMHRPAGDLALQVPERHFKCAQRAGAGLVTLGCKSFADVGLIAYAAVHRLR